MFSFALIHNDVIIKTFINILLFNAWDHGHLAGTKQRKSARKIILKTVETQKKKWLADEYNRV